MADEQPWPPAPAGGITKAQIIATGLAPADIGAAPIDSPAITGTPTVPTAAVDTTTTQAASTAFMIGQASAAGDGTPKPAGTAARGASKHYARADHVHPGLAGGSEAVGGVLMPLMCGGNPIPTAASAVTTAFKASFARAIVPITGVLHDLIVYNGATVAGNTMVAVFDTGDTTAGSYTLLWSSGSVAAAGVNSWQTIGDPNLAVTAGQQLLLAVMSDSTTNTFGRLPTSANAAATQLPANFLPAPGGAAPKYVGTFTYASLAFSTITEAQLAQLQQGLMALGRVV